MSHMSHLLFLTQVKMFLYKLIGLDHLITEEK